MDIGIIDESNTCQTMKMLADLYSREGFSVYCQKISSYGSYFKSIEDTEKKIIADIFIFSIDSLFFKEYINNFKFDVLIFLCGDFKKYGGIKSFSPFLKNENFLIINSDEKSIFPFFIEKGTTLITCGLNNKANVTMSSVIDDEEGQTIQCCIQRTIKTYKGENFEPQEFPVKVEGNNCDISRVLAAVAAAIANDVEISELNFPDI